MTVTLTPNTSLWETGIKKRAEEVFGAADYEAIEVFTALKSLLERVAKLEGQLAASGR